MSFVTMAATTNRGRPHPSVRTAPREVLRRMTSLHAASRRTKPTQESLVAKYPLMYNGKIAGHCYTPFPHAYWRLAASRLGIKCRSLIILGDMLDRADRDRTAHVSYDEMGRDTGQNRATVAREVADLVERGLLSKSKSRVRNGNAYDLTPFLDQLHVVAESQDATATATGVAGCDGTESQDATALVAG